MRYWLEDRTVDERKLRRGASSPTPVAEHLLGTGVRKLQARNMRGMRYCWGGGTG